ncbi:MAG TPA: patatin-like phospholipase family protein [Bacteroidales bacterium]|nr:patatin-like phospholipase family protein [Bacteroidales bacterium]HPT22029.1 patatin-like phospholipase family protein [Bacteroidales bacterium]
MPEKKYKIGLVLSGGGARGFAHLGLIEALHEAGIYPDIISGTSAGALVGVLYADGYSPKEIMKLMDHGSTFDFVRPAMPREGLLQISGIIKILKSSLRAKTFEELKIPLFVTATDLNNGKAVRFSKGELVDPVIASSSIPVLFQPVIINNVHYVDGGVMDNLPVKPIENKCKYLIGSFVNPVGYTEKITGLITIAERAFQLNMSKEALEKENKFDLFVAPTELVKYGVLDPEKAEEIFQLGYKATKEKLKTIDIVKCFDL